MVGPWAGFVLTDKNSEMIPSRARTWAIARFGERGDDAVVTLPTTRLVVANNRVESLVRHFIARLLPGPSETQYTLQGCREGAIHSSLGKDYKEPDALVSRQAFISLGVSGIAKFLNSWGLAEMFASIQPKSETWMRVAERSLLNAGADVEFAKILTKHPSWIQVRNN